MSATSSGAEPNHPSIRRPECRLMAGDAKIEQLRAAVSCAVVLEKHGYKLDQKESSRHSMKYRRGKGETIIVCQEGKGWWDTGSPAKGDLFLGRRYKITNTRSRNPG